jgi:hypothetical protein
MDMALKSRNTYFVAKKMKNERNCLFYTKKLVFFLINIKNERNC